MMADPILTYNGGGFLFFLAGREGNLNLGDRRNVTKCNDIISNTDEYLWQASKDSIIT